jgi:hypothetical protein
MSRKLFAFLLSELKTARVICPQPQCGAVTEVSVAQLSGRFDRHPCCPLCKKEFFDAATSQPNPIERLADAIRDLQADTKRVQIEFVLPDDSDK